MAQSIRPASLVRDVAELMKANRRVGGAVSASQVPTPAKDRLVIATNGQPATWQLSAIPLVGDDGSSLNLSLNGLELDEATDYSVDYTTGIVTFSAGQQALFAATPTPADVLTADYLTSDEGIANTQTVDTGVYFADTFNRTNSTTTINPASDGGTWTTDGSPWGIYSNRAYAVSPGTGDTTIIWVTGLTTARRNTGSLACDITAINYRQSSGNPSFGLLFSANPATGYGYAIYNTAGDPTKVFLGSCQSGSIVGGPASPATVTSWAGGTATFEVQHDGSGHITVLMNGSTILAWDDSASTAHLASSGGWVGPMGHAYNDPTSAFSFDTWDNFTAGAV